MKKPSGILASGLTLVVFLAAAGACDNGPVPSGPTAPPIQTPAATALVLAPFHLSGVVTDEDGQGLPNAQVVINYYTVLVGGRPASSVKVTYARTDAQGRYEMDIEAVRNAFTKNWLSGIVAFGYARIDSGTFPDEDFQYLTSTTSTVVGNFRLNRFVTLAAGDSATVTFLRDDSVCVWSDFRNTLCRYLRVTVPADGTLTVAAAPLNGVATPVSFVVLEGEDMLIWQGGSGTMNYAVKAGGEVLVALNMPPGFTQARSYSIRTSFSPNSR